MAASDSTPLPLKNQALQITFGLWLTTGLPNTGAAGLDSEVSKDNGAFADCTNESTEIGSTGTYTLDLTNTEMNADVVAIQVKSSTTDAIIYKITIYPSSLGKLQVDVRSLLGTAWLTPGTAGTPDVNVKLWNALTTVELPLVPTTAGRKLDVSAGGEAGLDWANIGSPTTAQNLSGTNIDVDQVVASVSGAVGSVTGAVGSVAAGGIAAASFAANSIAAASIAADSITAIADGVLKRDWTAVTGEASRSTLNALRFLRNGFTIAGTTLTVLEEDDTTAAYTRDLTTDPTAEPIIGVS